MATPKSRRSAAPGEIPFGQVAGVFGVHGELRVILHNRDSQLLHGGLVVVLRSPEGDTREAHVQTRPGAGGRVLAKVKGLDTPEEAAAFMGWDILIHERDLPPLEDGEYYHVHLLGLRVVTASGEDLGRLAEIHATGGVEVWEARGGGRVAYIPALSENILAMDRAAGRLVVRDGCASIS